MKKYAMLLAAASIGVPAVMVPTALGGAFQGANGPIGWGDRTAGMNGVSSVALVTPTGTASGVLPAAITTPPSWSRSGGKIAWIDSGMFGTSVKVANSDGTGAITIASGQSVYTSNYMTSISLSADGTKVAVASSDGTIHLLDASTPNQSLTNANLVVTDSGVTGQSVGAPALSANGKLAYVGIQSNAQGSCNATNYPTVWVVDIASPGIGTELPATCVNGNNRSYPLSVSWSPDSTKLIYTVDKSQAPDFAAVINADGTGNPSTVYSVPNTEALAYATFSPDGTQLAMTQTSQSGAQQVSLVTMPWDGSAAGTAVVTAGASTRQPNISWGPLASGGDSNGGSSSGGSSTGGSTPSPTSGPAVTLAPPTVNTSTPGENAVVTVAVQLAQKGKYTFIFEKPTSNEMSREQATSSRVPMQKGTRIGTRRLKKTYTAAVITTTADNAKVVTRALLKKAQAKKLNLRVVYAPTGTAQSESVIKIK